MIIESILNWTCGRYRIVVPKIYFCVTYRKSLKKLDRVLYAKIFESKNHYAKKII